MSEPNKTILDKLNAGRCYRNTAAFEVRSEGEEGQKMTVRGYATTFNQPYELRKYKNWNDYDVTIREKVDARAFDNCEMDDVIFQYNHEGRVFARKSNGTLRLSVDTHGLMVEADLGGTQSGRDLYEEIRGGYTSKMSFGFKVEEDEIEEKRDSEKKTIEILRTIKKVSKLYDVSAVSWPANGATEISARKFGDGVIEGLEKEFLENESRKKSIELIKLLTEV